MADFEHHHQVASNIAREIERKLAILGLDWRDHETMRRVAKDVLADKSVGFAGFEAGDPAQLTYLELQGLIGLMLRTMEEGADGGQHVQGSDAWRALARALWNEHDPAGKLPQWVSRET